MADAPWLYSEFLYRMLSRRKNGRPFYEPVQERSDPELLSSECIDDIKRISDASEDTRKIGLKLIEKEIPNVPREKTREILEYHLKEIEDGQRDFRF